MKVKSKISLGLLFLFAVIILLGGTGAYYLNKLSNQSKGIIKDNYKTIQYCKTMLQILDEMERGNLSETNNFEQTLQLQELNITEQGEKELTQNIRQSFEKYKNNSERTLQLQVIRRNVYKISDINLQALLYKNKISEKASENALTILAMIAAICFIISFVFLINFPGYIANPIQKLTDSIRQIERKNYHQRINFESSDEFGELALAFNSMAERMEEYENSNLAKLMIEKKRVEAIINQMKEVVIGFDKEDSILFMNTEACALFQFDEELLQYSNSLEALKSSKTFSELLQCAKGKSEFVFKKNGKEQYYLKDQFYLNKDEKESDYFIVLRNITRFKELDTAKTNFIATVSHELKTPLASMDIGLRLLGKDADEKLSASQKEIIEDIRKDNVRLMRLVSELLDISQAETGNINLEIANVNVKEVIDFSVAAMKQQANEKQISFKVEVEDYLKPIKADKEKSIWVLINLISNAIRYSPAKTSILISAKPALSKINFCVKDQGIGIPLEYQEKIFHRFYKIPNENINKGGSGLGLSISREFMSAMGGAIQLKSEPGNGAEFTLSFQQA